MVSINGEATDDGVLMERDGVECEDSLVSNLGGLLMPYPAWDASSFAADSPTNFQSPQTPSVNQSLLPTQIGDFSYLDPAIGDFPLSGNVIGDAPTTRFSLQAGYRALATVPDQYSMTRAPSPSPYTTGGAWLAQAPLATVMPTPPTMDDSSKGSPSDEEEEEEEEQSRAGRKRKAAPSPRPGGTKRQTAALRTASRAPRKQPNILPQRPTETAQDVEARAAHNQVEQQYRRRLNGHFERLLAVLPEPATRMAGGRSRGGGGGGGRVVVEKRVSKADVLDLATERIQELERQMGRLEREGRELREKLAGCIW